INGQIRLQKPPLPYWCTAVLYRLLATNEIWARFPVGLLGVFGTLLMYDLARKIFGPRAALCAGLVWITTQFVVEQFRIATADPYLTFFTLLSVWAWVARVPLLTYVALGLAMIAKGPVIFITALSAIGAFQ